MSLPLPTSLETAVRALPNANWNRGFLSYNPAINAVIFELLDPSHPDWDFSYLSLYIGLDYIVNHPQYPWDMNAVWQNTFIKLKTVKDHPEFPWDWTWISSNIDLQEIIDNPNEPWDWNAVSQQPKYQYDTIQA